MSSPKEYGYGSSCNNMAEAYDTKAAADSDAADDCTTTISILALGDEITVEIFTYLGAMETARVASVCQNWNLVCRNSQSLWESFVYNDYYLPAIHGNEESSPGIVDWYAVYAYIRTEHNLQQQAIHDGSVPDPLPTQLVFSDDGSPQPGNPPENALNTNPRRDLNACFCTNAFVDKDVDLVASLSQPCLITHFLIGNGGFQYTAPVKEALAFASMEMPDLDAAREFDGANKGSEWARKLFYNNNENNEMASGKYPIKTGNPNQPLAGFLFPEIPLLAFNMTLKQACTPVVAQFVHFKLLSSSHCRRRVSNNIDVQTLHVFGIALPRLPELLLHQQQQQPTSTLGEGIVPALPNDPNQRTTTTTNRIITTTRNYQRHHQVREYPWHIHDEFIAQQQLRLPDGSVQQLQERQQHLQEQQQHLQGHQQHLQEHQQHLQEQRRHLQERRQHLQEQHRLLQEQRQHFLEQMQQEDEN